MGGLQLRCVEGEEPFEVHEAPDLLVEIADRESADAREAVMKELEAADALAPMLELFAAPPRDTLVESLH